MLRAFTLELLPCKKLCLGLWQTFRSLLINFSRHHRSKARICVMYASMKVLDVECCWHEALKATGKKLQIHSSNFFPFIWKYREWCLKAQSGIFPSIRNFKKTSSEKNVTEKLCAAVVVVFKDTRQKKYLGTKRNHETGVSTVGFTLVINGTLILIAKLILIKLQ